MYYYEYSTASGRQRQGLKPARNPPHRTGSNPAACGGFPTVNHHRWDALLSAIAPNVHHRFAGAHALGGERHDKVTLRRWFERVGRVLPNLQLMVNHVWVKGWPWHTTVFVQWDATSTLLNGDRSYFNRGLHVITMRWGRVYALDVFEDSQEVVRGLATQAAAGLIEAIAEPIVS